MQSAAAEMNLSVASVPLLVAGRPNSATHIRRTAVWTLRALQQGKTVADAEVTLSGVLVPPPMTRLEISVRHISVCSSPGEGFLALLAFIIIQGPPAAEAEVNSFVPSLMLGLASSPDSIRGAAK